MRRLSPGEAALWRRLAKTVAPINPSRTGEGDRRDAVLEGTIVNKAPPPVRARTSTALHLASHGQPPRFGEGGNDVGSRTLDATWDRKLAKGLVPPDFTLDLHGHSLDAAHARLDSGITQALAQGARVLLLITGRPRPADDRNARGERRGAIRAKFLDWLAAGPHAGRIAAVRPAHPRHGGAGAVYLVLRRAR